jgi:hypothetical protein
MPRGWTMLARTIRARDKGICRRCERPDSSEVNHILPRRIAPELIADHDNLCVLCPRCHGIVTQIIEPQLYMGDIQHFDRLLNLLRATGPVPSREQIGAAYAYIRAHLVTT